MKKNFSIYRISFFVYLILLIFSIGVPNINLNIVIIIFIISLLLYLSKKLTLTLIGFILISIIFLVHNYLFTIDIKDLELYEESAIGLQILPYYLLGILILFILLIIDIKNN